MSKCALEKCTDPAVWYMASASESVLALCERHTREKVDDNMEHARAFSAVKILNPDAEGA